LNFFTTSEFFIKAIRYVDEVIYQDTFEFPIHKLDRINPDIIFESTEHKRNVASSAERILIDYTDGISSSIIKERIIEADRRRGK
jgi:glycerol-3-phosphate cytidylyltransferase-like family protein